MRYATGLTACVLLLVLSASGFVGQDQGSQIQGNTFTQMLDEKNVLHIYNVIPGDGHDVKVWKNDLYHVAQVLFREPEQAKKAEEQEKGPERKPDESQPASTNVNKSAYPRVHPDLQVTLHLKAPAAKKVQVVGNFGLGKGGPWEMKRGEDGVWTVTTPPGHSRFPLLHVLRRWRHDQRPRQRHLLRHRQTNERDRNPREGGRFLSPQGRAPRRGPLALVQVQGDGANAPRPGVYAAQL
jgi:hypothetical protein